jgi:hypothetical protein
MSRSGEGYVGDQEVADEFMTLRSAARIGEEDVEENFRAARLPRAG